VLGRVLGEVATPSLGDDLLQFVGDDRDELRAAAARAMSHAERGLAFDVLKDLVGDPIWFVRLRAIISLGQLCEPRAIPDLIRGLQDSHRLVRLRAGEGLVRLKTAMIPVFRQVIATQDRYGLHAYLTALENAGLRGSLEEELQASTPGDHDEKERLRKILQAGSLLADEPGTVESGAVQSVLLR
jgi:HEAT repeat protein